jgi:hypothetical protein
MTEFGAGSISREHINQLTQQLIDHSTNAFALAKIGTAAPSRIQPRGRPKRKLKGIF